MKNPNMKSKTISRSYNTKVSNSIKYPPISQSSKEDDYIASLQKQVYYLELEMKLMKDKEIETKNKVGGYEVLFRDGIPLNENFLALKTKYTDEKDKNEATINSLNNIISNTEAENQSLQMQIDRTNKNYYDLIESLSQTQKEMGEKIFDMNGKLFNETNTLTLLNNHKDKINKDVNKFVSLNIHNDRTIEKNKLFKEDPEEKNEKLKKAAEEKFEAVDRSTEKSLLEYYELEKKLLDNSKLRLLEAENMELLSKITKLGRDSHMAQARIQELENSQELNIKYLLAEEAQRNVHQKENEQLNAELDNLSKLNEEKLKEKVKESEEKQMLLIKNKINNNELKIGLLLSKYKDDEATARQLLEDKNALTNKILLVKEDIEKQKQNENEKNSEIISLQININQLDELIKECQTQLDQLINENVKLKEDNINFEKEIQEYKVKIDEIQQKIELNSMLKDIDINELKMLTHNNIAVNTTINNLINKWDKVHEKLEDIEKKEKLQKSQEIKKSQKNSIQDEE